jgi:hypothetical protein
MDASRTPQIGVRAESWGVECALAGEIDYLLVEFRGRTPWPEEVQRRLVELEGDIGVALHGFDSLSSPGEFDDETLGQIGHMVESSGARWLSEHICFAFPHNGRTLTFAAPLTPAAIDTVCANAVRLRDHIGIPVLVENLGRPVLWPWDTVDEIEAIGHIIRESECGLLLDLDQAATSAQSRGITTRHYVERLPLAYVYEVHLGMGQESLDLLQHILGLAPVRAITLEGMSDNLDDTRAFLDQMRKVTAR